MATQNEMHREEEGEEQKLLQLLSDAKEPQSVWDLKDMVGFDEGGVFWLASKLIERGEPVCFQSCEGTWQHFFSPEAMGYWITDKPDDLQELRRMVQEAIDGLRQMLSGIDKAKQALLTPPAPENVPEGDGS